MEFNHELIIPNEDLPFKLFVFEGKNGNYKRAKHWHRSIEIFLVLDGQLKFFINNKPITLTSNKFIIVNSNEVHSIEAPNPNLTIVVQIPISFFNNEEYPIFISNSKNSNEKLINIIKQMYLVYENKDTAYIFKMHSLFYELLYLMINDFMNKEIDKDTIHQKRKLEKLSNITSYIKENYNKDITLESVSKVFGFSPNYLSRMFKLYAGISYKTYLLDLRTEYAYREMLNTNHSLNDIAINNGFPNSRAYAKAFKKRYGLLPIEYRKKLKNNI